MKEVMEIMFETLEYGIVNANVFYFLRDVICQVIVDGGEILVFLEIKGIWFIYFINGQFIVVVLFWVLRVEW